MSEEQANIHEGDVVSLNGHKLVMTGSEGTEHSHNVAEATVTSEGKARQMADLKAGMKIRVTTKEGDQNMATGIEFAK